MKDILRVARSTPHSGVPCFTRDGVASLRVQWGCWIIYLKAFAVRNCFAGFWGHEFSCGESVGNQAAV